MRKELVFRMLSGLSIQATLLEQGVSSKGSNTMIKTRRKKIGEIVREKKFASFKHSIQAFLMQVLILRKCPPELKIYFSVYNIIPLISSILDKKRLKN